MKFDQEEMRRLAGRYFAGEIAAEEERELFRFVTSDAACRRQFAAWRLEWEAMPPRQPRHAIPQRTAPDGRSSRTLAGGYATAGGASRGRSRRPMPASPPIRAATQRTACGTQRRR